MSGFSSGTLKNWSLSLFLISSISWFFTAVSVLQIKKLLNDSKVFLWVWEPYDWSKNKMWVLELGSMLNSVTTMAQTQMVVHSELTQTQALGGRGREEACSQSAGLLLDVLLRRPAGRYRRLCYRSPAGLRNVSRLWMEAWRAQSEEEPGWGSHFPLHRGLEHSVWHCEIRKYEKHKNKLRLYLLTS